MTLKETIREITEPSELIGQQSMRIKIMEAIGEKKAALHYLDKIGYDYWKEFYNLVKNI